MGLWEGESGRWGSGLRHTPHHFYCPPPDTSFPPHIRYQSGSPPPTSSSDKMRAHQCRPNLLLLLLLVLVLSTKRVSSSTTLSCFSVGLLDLPTFGFNQEKQEEAEDKSEEKEGEGRQVSSSFDACFWGLLSFVVFSVVPAGLKSEVARVQERIHAALPLAGSPSPDFADYPQQIDDGNRRLDLNVYNYVDTSGPSNDLFEPPPPSGPPPNSVYEFIHQSSYGVGQAPTYSPSAYQEPSFGLQHAGQPSEGGAGWPPTSQQEGSPIFSPPISSSLLQDDWEGKLMVGNSGGGLASSIEQDYDDIDYTSGGLVTFHTSLSK